MLLDSAHDLINHVNAYYQDAWTKLITTITITSIILTILVAFIGIVMPLWLQNLQKQNFKDEREHFEKELKINRIRFKKRILKLESESSARINFLEDKTSKELEVYKDQFQQQIADAKGFSYFLQGGISRTEKRFELAVKNYMEASLLLIDAKNYFNAINAMANIILNSKESNVSKHTINEELKNLKKSIEKFIEALNKRVTYLNKDIVIEKQLIDKIEETKDFLNKLKDI